jgi:hypothetical protein
MNALQPSLTKDSSQIITNNSAQVHYTYHQGINSEDPDFPFLVGDNLAIMLQTCSLEQLEPFSKFVKLLLEKIQFIIISYPPTNVIFAPLKKIVQPLAKLAGGHPRQRATPPQKRHKRYSQDSASNLQQPIY